MKILAFFNAAGGIGKTTLIYHLAWMFSDLGVRTLAVDLDPQSALSFHFLPPEKLRELWEGKKRGQTVAGALEEGWGSRVAPHEELAKDLALLPGDPELGLAEGALETQWARSREGDAAGLRAATAIFRLVQKAGDELGAGIALLDLSPSLGPLNRCALLAADHVILPVVPSLFSARSLEVTAEALERWRGEWRECLASADPASTVLPPGLFKTDGYVVIPDPMGRRYHAARAAEAALRRAAIPGLFRAEFKRGSGEAVTSLEEDPYCLGRPRYYGGLVPMALEAGKPIFHLKPADGAIGAHTAAVADCRRDFRRLTRKILQAINLPTSEWANANEDFAD
jgi:cellulose biosynthesis protein BcsQ